MCGLAPASRSQHRPILCSYRDRRLGVDVDVAVKGVVASRAEYSVISCGAVENIVTWPAVTLLVGSGAADRL